MADDKETVAVINYDEMTYDQLLEETGKAWEAKDMKLMGKLSMLATKAQVAVAKAAKDALLAALVETTATTRLIVTKAVRTLVDAGKLDGAEGIWFSWDFQEKEEVGINPACRLVKSGRKAATDGGSSNSSYISNPTPSKELLDKVGGNVMFEEDTTRTIQKEEHIMPAGMTFKQAYDYSTNGGWRNSVRMALLKEAGLI